MNATQYKEEFEIRYYRWALEQFRREIDESYPHLRTFPTGPVTQLLGWLEQRPVEIRHRIATALVKRYQPKALELTGEILTEEEKGFIRKWNEKFLKRSFQQGLVKDKFLTGELRRVKRKRMRLIVNQVLTPLFGEPELDEAESLWYRLRLGRWSLLTLVDLGGRSRQLGYFHRIEVAPYSYLAEHVSLLAYLGISGQTNWCDLAEEDAEPVSRCLEDLCRRFVEALPRLINDCEMV